MDSFGEAVASKLLGKQVEVYLGSNSKSHEYLDYSVAKKEVIRGKFVFAEGDLVILEVSRQGLTNNVYLNIWNIYMMIEPKNGISVADVYCDADSKQVK